MPTQSVPLDAIEWSGPARAVDREHVKELAASIAVSGLLQPIGVVDKGGGKYRGIFGRHRYEAVKANGEKTIEATVLPDDEEDVDRRLAQVWENLKRRDLSPMELARSYKTYIEVRRAKDAALTYDVLAKELQISQPELSNTLMLLDQNPNIQKLVDQGRLSPGIIEHAVAPYVREVRKMAEAAKVGISEKAVDELAVKFAAQLARDKTDVKTAGEEARDLLHRFKGDLEDYKLEELVKTAKRKTCPADHPYGDKAPAHFAQIGGRLILGCDRSEYSPGHKWDAETGELYLSPAETKEVERVKAATTRARKAAAKSRKGEKREKVDRDFAVFFSRATIAAWAHGILDVLDKDLDSMNFSGSALGVSGGRRRGEDNVHVRPVALDDGKGAPFLTRLEVEGFPSLSNGTDNVAEGPGATRLRKIRKELLDFQRKDLKVKQSDDDLWPVQVSGFKLGDKVRIGEKSPIASYVGKQGVILAFDDWDPYDRYSRDASKKGMYAVLDIAASKKVHPVAALEKPVKFACAKCGAKVAVVEGKRICAKCGKSEGTCDCPPRKTTKKEGAK